MKKAIKTILTIYMLLLLTVTFGINNNNISLLAATNTNSEYVNTVTDLKTTDLMGGVTLYEQKMTSLLNGDSQKTFQEHFVQWVDLKKENDVRIVTWTKQKADNWAASTKLNNGTGLQPTAAAYHIFNYNDGSSFIIPSAAATGTACKFIPTAAVTDPLSRMVAAPASNKATNMGMCLAYIDVNGPKAPNTIVKCDQGSTRANCKVTNPYDIFPVFIDGSNLYLASFGAEAFYNNKK